MTRTSTGRSRKAEAVPAPTLSTLARKAGETSQAAGEASVRLATPVMRSLQQQRPETLAKMVLAAAAPRLIDGLMRFAIRNPRMTFVGVLIAAFVIVRRDGAATATAASARPLRSAGA